MSTWLRRLRGAIGMGVVSVAGRNRRFDELSLPLFAVWGAVPGVLFGQLSAVAAVSASTADRPR
ncbi:MAG TPA: hypothetical protein VJU15_09545 [Gemmatimonadales bacterium]|nr:hypothetical protein [Gemmatimonadales bacterium]